MSEESNPILRRWMEGGLIAGDLAMIDNLFAPNYANHGPRLGVVSREYTAQKTAEFLTDFSAWQTTIDHVFAEGEGVVAPGTVRGRYKDELQGTLVSPMGKLNGGTSAIPDSSSAKSDSATRVAAAIHHIHVRNHRPNGSEAWN